VQWKGNDKFNILVELVGSFKGRAARSEVSAVTVRFCRLRGSAIIGTQRNNLTIYMTHPATLNKKNVWELNSVSF
jgi:hypothetical protein